MIASEEGNCVTLSGVSSLHEGLKGKVEFQGRLTAKNKGGENSLCRWSPFCRRS